MRRSVLPLLLAAFLLVPSVSAGAQPAPSGGGEAGNGPDGGGSVTVGLHVPGSGGPASASPGGVTNPVGHVKRYWRVVPGSDCAGLGAEGPGVTVPEAFELVEHNLLTGEITPVSRQCFAPEDVPETPDPPPPPPTLDQLNAVAHERIQKPRVTLSPAVEGLTGLPTFFWYEGDPTIAVETTINGYAVSASMEAEFSWDTGESVRWSGEPGSATAPAQQWTYNTKGRYDVVLTVLWTGTWVFSDGDGLVVEGELSSVEVTATLPYTVNEIRSVLNG